MPYHRRAKVKCLYCGRIFPLETELDELRSHKDKRGLPCKGSKSTGELVEDFEIKEK